MMHVSGQHGARERPESPLCEELNTLDTKRCLSGIEGV